MSKPTFCAFCGEELDQGQEFLYQVEVETSRDPTVPLLVLQRATTFRGDPLRLCRECRESVDENRRDLLDEDERERRRTRRFQKVFAVLFVLMIVMVVLMSRA